jgi:hypothetical protein
LPSPALFARGLDVVLRRSASGRTEVYPGFRQKYARNIMMDVFHEDFRDSIALDIRIMAQSTIPWAASLKS